MIIVTAILLLATSCGQNENPAAREQETLVLVCISNTAHRYHSHYCRGLKECTHEVKEVTIDEAESMGRTPCGFYY